MTDTLDDDFATLFAASEQTARIETGQPVTGTIVALGSDVAFVNVGAKGEATIALDELRDDDGALEAAVGDRIEATVVSTAGGIRLSRKLQRGAATARQLEDASRSGLPVEGKVEALVKGGYSVTIARQRAFCPHSQIDTIREADPSVHLGRVYTFKITRYADGGRTFVVSRRALLEAENQVRADELRRSLAVGAVARGRIVSVREFGAFVDIGAGVQGLLHVSEMAWSRVAQPSAIVAPGQDVAVKILKIDSATGQIALGLKQLEADPWSAVPATFEVGDVREGRVTRLADFGAFVELAPGIEALAHASTFPPTGRLGSWAKSLAVGQTAAFEILSIDVENRRIGVSMRDSGSADDAGREIDVRDYAERAGAQTSTSFGSLADKLRGALKPKG